MAAGASSRHALPAEPSCGASSRRARFANSDAGGQRNQRKLLPASLRRADNRSVVPVWNTGQDFAHHQSADQGHPPHRAIHRPGAVDRRTVPLPTHMMIAHRQAPTPRCGLLRRRWEHLRSLSSRLDRTSPATPSTSQTTCSALRRARWQGRRTTCERPAPSPIPSPSVPPAV